MPTIVSVCHTPIELFNGSLGSYQLAGRGPVGAETGRFVVCKVDAVLNEPEDRGFNDRIVHQRDGKAFALAVATPYLERGVFVARGAEPQEDELEAAEGRYHNWLRSMVSEGLGQWEKHHRPELVDVHAKIGAHVFRMNAPWGAPVRTSITEACPGCGEPIPMKLIYHAPCDTVVDQEEGERIGHPKALEVKRLRLELAKLEKDAAVPAGKGR